MIDKIAIPFRRIGKGVCQLHVTPKYDAEGQLTHVNISSGPRYLAIPADTLPALVDALRRIDEDRR